MSVTTKAPRTKRTPATSTRKLKVAEVAEIAVIDYEPIKLELRNVLGTKEEWLKEARHARDTLCFAIAAIGYSPSENAAVCRQEWDAAVELRDSIAYFKKRYQGLAELLGIAEARLLIGMARHAEGIDQPPPEGS